MLVLANVPPIDLLAEERQETFQLCKELTCADLQEIARAKEAIRKNGRRRLVEKWQMRWHSEQTGRWTYRLIPELATWLNREHGEVGFYLAQALSGHGCFNAYLRRSRRETRRCVATAISWWIPQITHSFCLHKMGCGKGGPRSGSGCRWSLSCSSQSGSGSSSSHSSHL